MSAVKFRNQGWSTQVTRAISFCAHVLALVSLLVVIMLLLDYWKDIPSLDYKYQASYMGFIKRKKFTIPHPHSGTITISEKFLVQKYEKDGYKTIRTMYNKKRRVKKVHRLVAEAFLGSCPDGMQCCHNNGIHYCNRGSNLRWGTPKENAQDKIIHGKSCAGEKNHSAILKEGEAWLIKKICKANILFDREVAAMFKVKREVVNSIKIGRSWKHLEV